MKKYKLNNLIKDWLSSDFEPFEKDQKTFIKLPDNPNVKYLGFLMNILILHKTSRLKIWIYKT